MYKRAGVRFRPVSASESCMRVLDKNGPWIKTAATVAGPIALLGVLWFLLYYFGLELALVMIPCAVAAAFAYRLSLKRLEQKTREMAEASRIHMATVEALATAIDARDQLGVGHVRRTQIYAVGLGRAMGLSEKDITAIRMGALLHDIGKLAVPDHILNKPGSLTPAELIKAKIHSRVGASILEKVGFDCPVVPTVKYHHENWDGTGYPDKLKGEAIPLTARILSIADAFDKLRGARPYRPAVSRDEAVRMIRNQAGTRFDPQVVDVLISSLPKFESEIDAERLSYAFADTTTAPSEKGGFVEQIKLANREVFGLYEFARELSSCEDLPETLETFTARMGEFVPFDTCVVYLLDDTKAVAWATFVIGKNSETMAAARLRVGEGATGLALKTQATVRDVDPDLDFHNSQAEMIGQYCSMASVPLIDDQGVVGAVTIYSSRLVKYGDEHIRLLETISRIAAEAVGKSLRHDEARTHAMTDPMTGLPNARNLQGQFEKEVARADRNGASFQLLMLDLDRFKPINDLFGHKIGDQMLRDVAQVILAQLREYDFLARYGGDEFVALIPQTTPEDVSDLCDRIERAVSEFAIVVDDKIASVGVSLGAASYPDHGRTFDQLIVAADKTMYDRKLMRKLEGLPEPEPFAEWQHTPDGPVADRLNENLIVEIDERHIVTSGAVN